MGLMQQAYKTFECAKEKAGVYEEGMTPLAPVFHKVMSAGIEVTLDEHGRFIQACMVPDEETDTISPVTIGSESRTSGVSPHPLCEQVKYLIPKNKKHYGEYISGLEDWASSEYSHPAVRPVLDYVKRGTFEQDIAPLFEGKGNKKKTLKPDTLIRWQVIGIGSQSGPCWDNMDLFDAYIRYYTAVTSDGPVGLCMITGKMGVLTDKHPKSIVSSAANAKLISSNDENNFVFRGRFLEANEALTVSLEASQKAHNAIRWIARNQGVNTKTGCIIVWDPEGKKLPKPVSIMLPPGSKKEDVYTLKEYKDSLSKAVYGWKREFLPSTEAVIAIFTAPIIGRISVMYYNEMSASEFVDRLAKWDSSCCWVYGDGRIGAVSLYDIAKYASGKYKGNVIDTGNKRFEKDLARLLSCRLGEAKIPRDMVKSLVMKAESLYLYDDSRESGWMRRKLLFITCAAVRKYYYDHHKEEWEMSLEPGKTDRSYQFGRLLAILEKAERDTYPEAGKREPKAMCMQPAFTRRPMHTSRFLIEHVKRCYFRKLKPGARAMYSKLIDQIMEMISGLPDVDKPLEDSYLFGYSLQKNDLYKKREKTSETEEAS